ncbi:SAM-dependent methyltransferase [Nocardiopsis lambiniae]|uniref:SAM-dependent methyltransferase n=1 Tax=Nocardiopsis lambiniae TaxID=3075539 RepID=A0ABU2MC59_9ACTN|nr:SAM-dependent methyltransferase [Nocardiopsis sp. DSM 44743]MDT0330145.1 SAM-dependent methyltransferase [Nocardiopsis sp. DSM 44743]
MADRFPPDIDMETPSVARMYDYLLGGKDNFEVDRKACDVLLAQVPEFLSLSHQNRAFLTRAVEYAAARGIDQFLDLGAGLPTADNTHQAAQRVLPGSRVLYVDNDPIVIAHGRALLAGGQGAAFLHADFSEGVESILTSPEAHALLDVDRPLGVMLVSTLHCVPDSADPFGMVAGLMERLAPGSFLIYSHIVSDDPEAARWTTDKMLGFGTPWGRVRSPQEAGVVFEGLEPVSAWADDRDEEPRIVDCASWRHPEIAPRTRPGDLSVKLWEFSGVAVKP